MNDLSGSTVPGDRTKDLSRGRGFVLGVSLFVLVGSLVLLVDGHRRFGPTNAPSTTSTQAAGFDLQPRLDPAAAHRITLRPGPAVPVVGENLEWNVVVSDREGRPVSGCDVQLDGWMPAHGHGLPTAPRTTARSTPGQYLVQGMRFSMEGHWELTVVVKGCGGESKATFDLRL